MLRNIQAEGRKFVSYKKILYYDICYKIKATGVMAQW